MLAKRQIPVLIRSIFSLLINTVYNFILMNVLTENVESFDS